ncbi:hypothetical protein ACC761_40145, partial [Rhizobium ruizarguesonis]
ASVLQSATIMPLFVVIITSLGVYFTQNTQLLFWALLTLTCSLDPDDFTLDRPEVIRFQA